MTAPVIDPPVDLPTAGCSDRRGHGDYYSRAGWVWCGRCVTRMWPDPKRKGEHEHAAAEQTACQRAGRHLGERVMGKWIVCSACGDSRPNPNWHGRIAAAARALAAAAPPLSGGQADTLRRLIPHTP